MKRSNKAITNITIGVIIVIILAMIALAYLIKQTGIIKTSLGM